MSFDPNKPCERRDKKPGARVVYTFKTGSHVVVMENERECYTIHRDGSYFLDLDDERDIINIPEKIEGWQIVYKIGRGYSGGNIHPDNITARQGAGDGAIACIKVSFTEGEGLNGD